MKKLIAILLSIMFVLVMSLPAAAFSTVAVKSIKLGSSSITLNVGKSSSLKVAFSPANTTQKQLTYATSNKKVATVDGTGKITAIGKGTATITVYAANKKVFAKCKVTVTIPQVTNISIMTYLFDPEPPAANSPIQTKIEQLTNTKLNITWVPGASYADKVNLTIASGDMPQMIHIGGDLVKAPSIVNALRGGVFWEVGPYMNSFPNLSKASKAIDNNISLDGKLYGLYRERWLTRSGIVYRKDWLNNLGLAEPKTINDLYTVIKAFTLNDPDKDGKNDTVGLVDRSDLQSFGTMAVYFGAPFGWGVEKGKVTPAFMTKAYMDCMNFYRKLYSEKLINQDFAVVQDYKDPFDKGIGGMMVSVLDDADGRSALTKSNPNAVVDVISRIQGPSGVKVPGGAGHNGEVLFSKSSIKNEAQLKDILSFMDKMGGKDVADLLTWGIEGQTYSITNGKPSQSKDQMDQYMKLVNAYWQLAWRDITPDATPGDVPALTAKYTKMIYDNIPLAVTNVTAPLVSDTYSQQGSQLDQIIRDSLIKYVMGSIDVNGWNSAIQQWKQSGGDKVITEFNAAYQKGHK